MSAVKGYAAPGLNSLEPVDEHRSVVLLSGGILRTAAVELRPPRCPLKPDKSEITRPGYRRRMGLTGAVKQVNCIVRLFLLCGASLAPPDGFPPQPSQHFVAVFPHPSWTIFFFYCCYCRAVCRSLGGNDHGGGFRGCCRCARTHCVCCVSVVVVGQFSSGGSGGLSGGLSDIVPPSTSHNGGFDLGSGLNNEAVEAFNAGL